MKAVYYFIFINLVLLSSCGSQRSKGDIQKLVPNIFLSDDALNCPYYMSVTREVFSEIKPGMKIGIFIGPEGGFAKSEVEEAKKIGARAITLGRRILRTETAGMATMSVLMYLMEE